VACADKKKYVTLHVKACIKLSNDFIKVRGGKIGLIMATFIEQLAQMHGTPLERRKKLSNTIELPKPKRLVPQHIQDLKAYQPGRPASKLKRDLGIDQFINLASNENPLGPPETVIEAVRLASSEIHRYPESGGAILKEALANKYDLWEENVAIGSGSESIMANIIRAFVHGSDEIVTSEGTFIGFYVLVGSHGVKLKTVPLKDYHFDLDGLADAVTNKTKLIYLCNPNNPTGTIYSREEFEAFMRKVPEHVLVIVDEAYFEFTMGMPQFPDSMIYRHDNVLTLRTFSKAFGMAGIRLGYGLGHDYLINFVNRVKLPFEPNNLAQAAGVAALTDTEYLRKTLENNDKGMRLIASAFDELGLRYVDSYANFMMVPFGSAEKVKDLHEKLLRQGVAIRPLHAFGLPDCFRVTIGLPEENETFIQALKKCL
jgi:histidinol-phosphate aminotransferase